MLILTRRVGETVTIGDDVTCTVVGVKGEHVRLGIKAPKDIAVHREEVFDRIQQQERVNSATTTGIEAPSPLVPHRSS